MRLNKKRRFDRGADWLFDLYSYEDSLRTEAEKEEEEEKSVKLCRLKRNLAAALREDITETQRLYLSLYYGDRLNMREIGERMGVDKSTVSRTIKRGKARLYRCLKYEAADLYGAADLFGMEDDYADDH